MLAMWALLLYVLGTVNAELYMNYPWSSCPTPKLDNGRVRMRQRSNLAKFICYPRYELAGNKYAICRDKQWDVSLPVCVRPSCPIPEISNGLRVVTHRGAWVIFFCLPDHELVGSSAIYCDGAKWNASAPRCVDARTSRKTSCDFEDPAICGWTQDNIHDFDWKRHSWKTPSSFLYTGPSYDHTLGKNETGHYMYIESTTQVENDKARLISPVYPSNLSTDGCFSLYYHMYGKTCGGLRVYQKPRYVTLRRMLDLSEDEKQTYLLFEKWGEHGDIWLNAVVPLKDFSVDFQIVVEGIRGKSVTSDIAIDDVAILQGENCTITGASPTVASTTPNIRPDSCVNRCTDTLPESKVQDSETQCMCAPACIYQHTCCSDFFDTCFGGPDSTTAVDDNVSIKNSSEQAPQTLKLVAVTTETVTTTTTPIPTTTVRTTTSTRPTTSKPTTTTSTPSTSRRSTTLRTRRTTTRKLTTQSTTTPHEPTTTSTVKTTKKIVPKTTVIKLSTTTPMPDKKTTTYYNKVSKPIVNDSILEVVGKARKEKDIENKQSTPDAVKGVPQETAMSTGAKVSTVILALVICSAAGFFIVAGFRSTRGLVALARFRSTRNSDPEVRYLSNDVDDD